MSKMSNKRKYKRLANPGQEKAEGSARQEKAEGSANQGWEVTTNIEEAMAKGYIGETFLIPNKLSQMIHLILTNKQLPMARLYYCGTPDERLNYMFKL